MTKLDKNNPKDDAVVKSAKSKLSASQLKPKEKTADAPTSQQDDKETIVLNEKIDTLTSKLELLTKQNKEMSLYHEAEKRNTMDRMKRETDKARDYSIQKFANSLLSVADALHLGIDNSEGQAKEGMEMTLNLLMKTFNEYDIQTINPVNEKYDHTYHEAISMQPDPKKQENDIIMVVQVGYKIKERLLRPARVIVVNNNS